MYRDGWYLTKDLPILGLKRQRKGFDQIKKLLPHVNMQKFPYPQTSVCWESNVKKYKSLHDMLASSLQPLKLIYKLQCMNCDQSVPKMIT